MHLLWSEPENGRKHEDKNLQIVNSNFHVFSTNNFMWILITRNNFNKWILHISAFGPQLFLNLTTVDGCVTLVLFMG